MRLILLGNASPRITPHHPASDAVTLALRVIGGEAASPAPPCPACGSPVARSEDLLCDTCYSARRGPGRVLRFDPDRRSRTLARLAGRPCAACGAVAWRVNARGDATCGRCFPDSSSTPARPLAGRPVSPGAPGAGRGGVYPRGAA